MSLVVLGMNHRTADFGLLERAAVPAEELPKALRALVSRDHVMEAVVVSTCNRVEVYAHASRFHGAVEDLVAWFSAQADVPTSRIEAASYAFHDDRAAAHLFAVAAGIDSLLVGERQVALQIREAARVAREEEAARRTLQRLFDHAVYTSRRVRAETDIGKGASSIVDLAVDAAGGVDGRTVLVVGAGKIGGLAADRLRRERPARVLVVNRTTDKADRLAARVGGEVVDDLDAALAAADLVLCCTGAALPVIAASDVAAARAGRERPLTVVDLALPHNVAPEVGDLPGVTLIGLAELAGELREPATAAALDAARAIVEEEAARFHAWVQAIRVEPTIRALRERAEGVRTAELERLSARLATLDERERAAVEALTRGIVNTLLHDPTVRLKALADGGGAEGYATALRDLFDLDDGA